MRYFILISAIFLCFSCSSKDAKKANNSNKQREANKGQELQAIVFKRANIFGLDSNFFAVNEIKEHHLTDKKIKIDGKVFYKLTGISVLPKENIFVKLTTKSSLPKDSIFHNWVLLNKNVDVNAFVEASTKSQNYLPSEYSDEILAQTNLAKKGETVEISFLGPEEKGKYLFLCTYPEHFRKGENGYLVVK